MPPFSSLRASLVKPREVRTSVVSWPTIKTSATKAAQPCIEELGHLRQPVSDERVLDTLLYIERNLHEDLRLRSLSERVGLSPFHFHRMVMESLGEPLHRYVTKRRMVFAAQRIRQGDAFQDVGKRIGYKTSSSFSSVFRRHFEMTPSAYLVSGVDNPPKSNADSSSAT